MTDQLVRVRSLGCGVECGADDACRLRAWDATYSIARFDNSSSQLTLLLVQNPTDRPHDAPYGALAGKALGLELTNGFSFDSAMVPRPR